MLSSIRFQFLQVIKNTVDHWGHKVCKQQAGSGFLLTIDWPFISSNKKHSVDTSRSVGISFDRYNDEFICWSSGWRSMMVTLQYPTPHRNTDRDFKWSQPRHCHSWLPPSFVYSRWLFQLFTKGKNAGVECTRSSGWRWILKKDSPRRGRF